jgi:subtilisin family serine protease
MFKMSLVLASVLFGQLAFGGEKYPEKVIVKLKPNQVLPQFAEMKSVTKLFGSTYVVATNNLDLLTTKLSNTGRFVYVQKSQKSQRRELPKIIPTKLESNDFVSSVFNDPYVSKIWSFDDASSNGVSVNAAYNLYRTTATTPVLVAVVDTGIDYNHEDLKDVVWTNTKEIPGNGIDDDGNGYIDDVHGINVLDRDRNGKATSDPMDKHYHGTHVSGTIAAKQNNGKGIAGIASNVKIMGIRTVPSSGDEKDIDVAEAFIYAAKNGARIINCSFGKYDNEGQNLIPDTLKYIADNYGVLVIVAAGNESHDIDKTPTYPAAYNSENLLVVASTTSYGSLSSFSNWGKIGVDVAAPGSDVYSTLPGNDYGSLSGTSMATPTTVGVAAEVLAHFPNLTYQQLKKVMIDSVTKVTKFQNKMVSGGRIDLLKAIETAKSL